MIDINLTFYQVVHDTKKVLQGATSAERFPDTVQKNGGLPSVRGGVGFANGVRSETSNPVNPAAGMQDSVQFVFFVPPVRVLPVRLDEVVHPRTFYADPCRATAGVTGKERRHIYLTILDRYLPKLASTIRVRRQIVIPLALRFVNGHQVLVERLEVG
jgi:hypothetical protein